MVAVQRAQWRGYGGGGGVRIAEAVRRGNFGGVCLPKQSHRSPLALK